jgi:hypothetical protein
MNHLDYIASTFGVARRWFESDRRFRKRIELALVRPVMSCTNADLLRIPGVRRVETPAPGHVVIRIPWWYPWRRRTRAMVEMILPVVMLRALEYRAWWW